MQESNNDEAIGTRNEVIVYQPNTALRMEVRVHDQTVWLTQEQIARLFGTKRPAITKHISNIFHSGELDEKSTCSILEHMGPIGRQRYKTKLYNLDLVISIGYRVNSISATRFRQWATSILRERLIRGVSCDAHKPVSAEEFDRRVSRVEQSVISLRNQVEDIVRSTLPAPEQIFMNGQFLDAYVEIIRLIKSAKKRIVLIDNFIDERVFVQLAERSNGVDCTIYSRSANKLSIRLAATKYAQQYPTKPITLIFTEKSHDRFLIIDETVWHLGASPKDAGARIFAMMKMIMKPDKVLSEI